MSMPISLDLDHISGPFLSLGAPLLKPIAESFERLGKWLNMRVKKVDLLDDASRMFPVVTFYNESVTLWVDEWQHGALRPEGSPGFGEVLASAGTAFVNGLKRVPEAYTNEMILPRFLEAARAGLQAIAASTDRFATPQAELFDPRLRTASDLFGVAALAFRALRTSDRQVKTFLFDQVLPAYRELMKGSGGPAAASIETPEFLDSIVRYLTGALMLLPQLPEFLVAVWKSVDLYIRIATIEKFAQIEQQAYALRAAMIDLIYVRLRTLLQTAASFVDVASFVVLGLAGFWLGFVRAFGKQLVQDLAKAGDQLTDYVRRLVNWIEDKFLVSWSKILNFDLAPVLLAILGAGGALIEKVAPPPSLTLLDLIHASGRQILVNWINIVGGMTAQSSILSSLGISDRLFALGRVVDLVFSSLGPRKFWTTLPIVPGKFPSIFDMWFKTASAAKLQATLSTIEATFPNRLSEIIDSASRALQVASYRFDDMAKAASKGGSLTEFTLIMSRATEQASRLFGDDIKVLRDKVAKTKDDIVVTSFESWLTTGGFFTVGGVLRQYVFDMLAVFREKDKQGADVTALITRTSPQILAKKAALARVRMQRLTIDARGRGADSGLAGEIAASFRVAIQTAFKTGVEEIRIAAESIAI